MSETGLHHVTAFSSPVARNLDFYTSVLGLRLVKKTVNFDDPGTYHLYYGDEAGHPGSILTFFPIPHAAPGRAGIGETQETAFRVPRASIGWWTHRFVEKGVRHEALVQVFGELVGARRDAVEIGDHQIGRREMQVGLQRDLCLERPDAQRRGARQRHRQDRRQRRIGDEHGNGLDRFGHG